MPCWAAVQKCKNVQMRFCPQEKPLARWSNSGAFLSPGCPAWGPFLSYRQCGSPLQGNFFAVSLMLVAEERYGIPQPRILWGSHANNIMGSPARRSIRISSPPSLQPCSPAALQACNPLVLQPSRPAALQPCNPAALHPCSPATLQPCSPPALQTGSPAALQPSSLAATEERPATFADSKDKPHQSAQPQGSAKPQGRGRWCFAGKGVDRR